MHASELQVEVFEQSVERGGVCRFDLTAAAIEADLVSEDAFLPVSDLSRRERRRGSSLDKGSETYQSV
jgi:hypothetical protein